MVVSQAFFPFSIVKKIKKVACKREYIYWLFQNIEITAEAINGSIKLSLLWSFEICYNAASAQWPVKNVLLYFIGYNKTELLSSNWTFDFPNSSKISICEWEP